MATSDLSDENVSSWRVEMCNMELTLWEENTWLYAKLSVESDRPFVYRRAVTFNSIPALALAFVVITKEPL